MSENGLFEIIKTALETDEDLHRSDIRLQQITSLPHLKYKLDETALVNEIHVEGLQGDLSKLGTEIEALGRKIATEELSKQDKLAALRKVRRLKKREESLTNILRIRQDNVDVHISLLHKIGEMESMGKKALLEPVIDEIQVEYEEKLGNHSKFVDSVKVLEEQIGYKAQVDESELDALERELIEQFAPENLVKEETPPPAPVNPNQKKIDEAVKRLVDAPATIMKKKKKSESPLREIEEKKLAEQDELEKEEAETAKLEKRIAEAAERSKNSRSAFEEELERQLKEGRNAIFEEEDLDYA